MAGSREGKATEPAAILVAAFFCFLPLLGYVLWTKFRAISVRKSKRPLPPGPWQWPIVGSLPAMISSPSPHRALAALGEKYGPLLFLRMGRVPTLVASNAAMAMEILKTQDAIFSSRPSLTVGKYLGFDRNMIVFCPVGDHFNKMRKIYAKYVLSTSRVAQTRRIREDEVRSMARTICRDSIPGPSGCAAINVTNKLLAMNSNTLTRIVFGKKYFGDEIDADGLQAEEYRSCLQLITDLLGSFYSGDYIPLLKPLDDLFLGSETKMKDLQARLRALVSQFLEEHRQRMTNRKTGDEDFLDVLLNLEGEKQMTEEQIIAACLELMLGGSESSATVVEWALAHLVNDPQKLGAVQAEIDEVVGRDRLMEESDIPNLPYLNCVMKESFRLHPPAPLGMLHMTTTDTELAGYFVPAQTTVIVNMWKIGRDPLYWKRPGEFFPERFVNSNVDLTGNDFQLIPFGSGRRRCPGMNFAIPVNLLSLGVLVHAFEWNCEEKVDMRERYGSLTCRLHPLLVPLRPRLSSQAYLIDNPKVL